MAASALVRGRKPGGFPPTREPDKAPRHLGRVRSGCPGALPRAGQDAPAAGGRPEDGPLRGRCGLCALTCQAHPGGAGPPTVRVLAFEGASRLEVLPSEVRTGQGTGGALAAGASECRRRAVPSAPERGCCAVIYGAAAEYSGADGLDGGGIGILHTGRADSSRASRPGGCPPVLSPQSLRDGSSRPSVRAFIATKSSSSVSVAAPGYRAGRAGSTPLAAAISA